MPHRDLVEGDDELLLLGFLPDQGHGEDGLVQALGDALEVDEGQSGVHGGTHRTVVGGLGIGALPLVPE